MLLVDSTTSSRSICFYYDLKSVAKSQYLWNSKNTLAYLRLI